MIHLEDYLTPYLEHDYAKCGLCWKTKIMADVAEYYLQHGAKVSLVEFYDEVDRRWKRTELYKEVQRLLNAGYSLEEVEKIMFDKGIEI